MEVLVEELLAQDECSWLEFKSFWYWNNNESPQNGWGELLKDFSALFNTNTGLHDKKYFIIGYDEKTKKVQQFNIDKKGEVLEIFNDLDSFKKIFRSKLKKHFKCYPEYKNSTNLIDIDILFEIEKVCIKEKEILLITIKSAPYLLELKKNLQANETFREGVIIVRKDKLDSSPENASADPGLILKLEDQVKKVQLENYPEKEISIKKIVDVFKEHNFPSAIISNKPNEHSLSSGLSFEIYTLKSEYSSTIHFVYFSKYTTFQKSLTYISENNLLEKNSKKIVLVDERNKKHGRTDLKQLKKLFLAEYNDVEVYYLEKFAIEKLYKHLFHDELFHEGNFNIKDFIKPLSDMSETKTADLLLKEWYQSQYDPLLVIKGLGGIGKTTVIKYFLDNLYKASGSKNLHILFINSHEIIDDIMKHSNIDDIFDFYRIVADKNDIKERFDKKLLELSIDNGNMIIVIDGLDEVIAKMGSKFNLNVFINSIFKDYSGNMSKSKIIITCRDFFWDEDEFEDIKTMSLEPFNEDMAKEYFEKSAKKYNFKVENAMKLANEFALKVDGEKISFVPYVLDMIKENLLQDDNLNSTLKTEKLLPDTITNDFIIAKACEREIVKLDNLSIDEQLEIFMYIAIEYSGGVHEMQFKKLAKELKKKSPTFMKKFQAHPLLEYQNEFLKFRYDFFNEFFKNLKIVSFLQENDFAKIDQDIVEILIHHISYDGSLSKALKLRLENKVNLDDLKFSVLDFLSNNINDIDFYDEETAKRLNSSLFILLLVLANVNDIESRTSLLKEIYEQDNNFIANLSIINLHTTFGNRPVFDFSNMKLNNCHFENYEYFTECKFNTETFFENSTFIAPLHRDVINSQLTWNNLEAETCNTEGIVDILNLKKEQEEQTDDYLRVSLKKILKFFWTGSVFKQKTEEELSKRLRDHYRLFEQLIKEKIFIKKTVTTKKKRFETCYVLDDEYSNLRKVMEENESCLEFEKIIKILHK